MMIPDVNVPVVTALATAFGSLVLGILAHRRAKKEVDASSLDSHLTALREMYKEFVNDLREEVDRLQEENRKLRSTVNQLNKQLRDSEEREHKLHKRLEAAEAKIAQLEK